MKTNIKRRLIGISHTLLLLSTLIIATPTQACACGMLVAENTKDISMKGERGVVIYDSVSQKEQMAIDFQLSGSSSESALVVPTPVQAEIGQIKNEAIDDLEELVSPDYEIVPMTNSLGSDGSSKNVEVLERKEIGSFEVAALKTNDYRDLYAWTKENGFHLVEEAESPVRSYIDNNFVLNVIKLKKNVSESDINPLKFTFQTEKLFYPLMEVNDERDSFKDKSLNLYILSDIKVSTLNNYANIINREYSKDTLEDEISRTNEKDYSNLDFSGDYFLTYIETSNYGNDGLILALGNPEMNSYEPLGLNYTEPSNDWIYVLVIISFLIAVGGLLFWGSRKKEQIAVNTGKVK